MKNIFKRLLWIIVGTPLLAINIVTSIVFLVICMPIWAFFEWVIKGDASNATNAICEDLWIEKLYRWWMEELK